MIASAVEMLAEAFAGAQTEIVVLMVAILAHRMLFTSTRVRAKPKKLASDLPAGTPSPASFLAPAPVAGRKVEALKAALASSDLEAALAHLGRARPARHRRRPRRCCTVSCGSPWIGPRPRRPCASSGG